MKNWFKFQILPPPNASLALNRYQFVLFSSYHLTTWIRISFPYLYYSDSQSGVWASPKSLLVTDKGPWTHGDGFQVDVPLEKAIVRMICVAEPAPPTGKHRSRSCRFFLIFGFTYWFSVATKRSTGPPMSALGPRLGGPRGPGGPMGPMVPGGPGGVPGGYGGPGGMRGPGPGMMGPGSMGPGGVPGGPGGPLPTMGLGGPGGPRPQWSQGPNSSTVRRLWPVLRPQTWGTHDRLRTSTRIPFFLIPSSLCFRSYVLLYQHCFLVFGVSFHIHNYYYCRFFFSKKLNQHIWDFNDRRRTINT